MLRRRKLVRGFQCCTENLVDCILLVSKAQPLSCLSLALVINI